MRLADDLYPAAQAERAHDGSDDDIRQAGAGAEDTESGQDHSGVTDGVLREQIHTERMMAKPLRDR